MQKDIDIMEQLLSPEVRRDLILTLGSNLATRRLTPIEVARYLEQLELGKVPIKDIAEFVGHESTSSLREIRRLLQLDSKLQDLVGWRSESPELSMSSASSIARLKTSEQMTLFKGVIENSLNHKEVRQAVETIINHNTPAEQAIQDIVRFRPTIERRYLFMGAIVEPGLSHGIEMLDSQNDRNELLRQAVLEGLGQLDDLNVKLTPQNFSLFGGDELAQLSNNAEPDFESVICSVLVTKLGIS